MELNKVDLNKIAVFCQVIDSGNYQRASEVLHVTPSALSQSITNLEHSLGFALFERRGRRLLPTKQGLKLHQEFREHQSGFFKALQSLRGEREKVEGVLKVGAYLEFAKSGLTPVLKEFVEEYSDARIKMVFDSPSRLQMLLHQGQLDLCFSIFPAADKKTMLSTPLLEQELVLISSHEFSKSPSFEEVLREPIIEYYFNHQPLRRWLDLHFGKKPKKLPVRIFAATAEMVLALVQEGAGIGIVPKYLVTAVEEKRGVRILRPTQKKLIDYIWLLESSAREKSPAQMAFRKKLEVLSSF